MIYSIDQVKRLVPEAKEWKNPERYVDFAERAEILAQLLLTTRRQLEIAREALERISSHTKGYVRGYSVRWANEAIESIESIESIDAINKEGDK